MRNAHTVTVFNAVLDEDSRAYKWIKCILRGVSYESRDIISANADYTKSRNRSAVIRVWTNHDIFVHAGDKIVPGIETSDTPPKDALCVSSVVKNHRGSARMRHWRINCE